MMKTFMAVLLTCVLAAGAIAEEAFQLSLTPDIALQDRGTSIKGVSVGLWNENPGTQWQIGIVNGSTGDSSGLQWGAFLPTILNYAENFTGAQLGLVNYASGNFKGLQWGAVNYAGQLNGLQLGFVNYAETADTGIQIGFLNIIKQNEQWFSNFPDEVAPGMIFVNWRL